MSLRLRESAWRKCLAPLRQEASTKGVVTRATLRSALEGLKAFEADIQDYELVEDLSFLVQQLVGPQASIGKPSSRDTVRDTAAHVALCRLLTSLVSIRTVRLHPSAANLILGALRQWADSAQDAASAPSSTSDGITASNTMGTATNSGSAVAAADGPSMPAASNNTPNLQLESLTALAALLPSHLGHLSEHERAAQLAALQSLLVPHPRWPDSVRGGSSNNSGSGSSSAAADAVELQYLALTTLAACCARPPTGSAGAGGTGGSGLAASASASSSSATNSGGGGAGLTADEAGALLSAAASLLQGCTSRSRPVEDGAHSRMYVALLKALHIAIGEARAAWVARAASLVEGLQRFFTYGVQASLAAGPAQASLASAGTSVGSSATPGTAPVAPPPPPPSPAAGPSGRYLPPHLRRRESQADGGGGGCSDSDMSDTEHAGGALGGGSKTSGGAVDRFRSSRVRLAALSCVQAMAQSDPRVLHAYWTALLPLQNPLQPRPLTPHLLTMLVHDPVVKVRAMAASTLASLLDGPAQRSILAVAEAKSMAARGPPLRGFLTLSLSLGQLLLGAHAGLLHAVAHEGSGLVLPGALRALMVLVTATPYERMPPELLPETLKVLRARWAALSAAQSALPPGEIGAIHAAYLACLAECLSTKQPIPGLAAYLQQQAHPSRSQASRDDGAGQEGDDRGGSGDGGGGGGAEELVRELVAVGRDPGAAAVLRIEALGALKGLAAHYMFAMPRDAWDDLRATAAMGLSSFPQPPPRSSPTSTRSREGQGPPSRASSSSSLSGMGPDASNTWLNSRAGERGNHLYAQPPAGFGPGSGAVQGPGAGSSMSPEDKAAQLSVKLVSEYLAAVARQCGLARFDPANTGAGDGDGPAGAGLGPAPSPGYVPLGAAVPRLQPSQRAGLAGLSPAAGAESEEEREGSVQRLVERWQDAVALLVPAATSHVSCMVQSAGLSCLGEIPEPVFSSLPPPQQQRILSLLSDAAGTNAVAATRAAACKALGTVAAFSAVLAHAELSDAVSRALALCLRDVVQSVRIAAGWAVANLCDAHRRRLVAREDGEEDGGFRDEERGDSQQEERAGNRGQQTAEQRLLRQQAQSHAQASTAAPAYDAGPREGKAGPGVWAQAPAPAALQPHHYRQLAVLCGEAIIATQDADKVRANGIRAVGNLLAALTPATGPGLEAASRAGGGGGSTPAGEAGKAQGDWRRGRGHGEAAAAATNTSGGGGGGGWRTPTHAAGGGSAQRAGRYGEGFATTGGSAVFHFDTWLDSALTCLQSSLTTGNMKVQWNACYATHGLLRNGALRAHPRVAPRVPPLLLLLVMLVRESGNFKIRTHAAAALAALPDREAYGDVLPDALLVVAGALEGLSGGGGAAGASSATSAAKSGGGPGGGAPAADLACAAGEEGDGGEGRFPNFRYTAGLCAQLRATLLHLLALAQPPDARRVRDALARRAEFIHACLRDQLAEATQALRVLKATFAAARSDAQDARGPGRGPGSGDVGAFTWLPSKGSAGGGGAGGAVELPLDPFGLSGSGGGRGASPRDAAGAGGMAGLLAGLSLSGNEPHALHAAAAASPRGDGAGGTGGGGGCGQALSVVVPEPEAGSGWGVDELRLARKRVTAMAGPLRGFLDLLTQLGSGCEAVRCDVQQALAQLPVSAVTLGA